MFSRFFAHSIPAMGCTASTPPMEQEQLQEQTLSPPRDGKVHLIVMGQSGVGKSSFLNSFLKFAQIDGTFKAAGTAKSVTQEPSSKTFTLQQHLSRPLEITLTDVPGFGDVGMKDAEIIGDLKAHLTCQGMHMIHGILFVEKMTEVRALKRHQDFMKLLQTEMPDIFKVLFFVMTFFPYPRTAKTCHSEAVQEAEKDVKRKFQSYKSTLKDDFDATISHDRFTAIDNDAMQRTAAGPDAIHVQRSQTFSRGQLNKILVALCQPDAPQIEWPPRQPPVKPIFLLHPHVLSLPGRPVTLQRCGGIEVADVLFSANGDAWKLGEVPSTEPPLRIEHNFVPYGSISDAREHGISLIVPDDSDMLSGPWDESVHACCMTSRSHGELRIVSRAGVLQTDLLHRWRLVPMEPWAVSFRAPKACISLRRSCDGGKHISGVTLVAQREIIIRDPGSFSNVQSIQRFLQETYAEVLAMDPYYWTPNVIDVAGEEPSWWSPAKEVKRNLGPPKWEHKCPRRFAAVLSVCSLATDPRHAGHPTGPKLAPRDCSDSTTSNQLSNVSTHMPDSQSEEGRWDCGQIPEPVEPPLCYSNRESAPQHIDAGRPGRGMHSTCCPPDYVTNQSVGWTQGYSTGQSVGRTQGYSTGQSVARTQGYSAGQSGGGTHGYSTDKSGGGTHGYSSGQSGGRMHSHSSGQPGGGALGHSCSQYGGTKGYSTDQRGITKDPRLGSGNSRPHQPPMAQASKRAEPWVPLSKRQG